MSEPICVGGIKGKDREMADMSKQIAALTSALRRVATSINLFTAIAIARQAIGAEPDPLAEMRKEAQDESR